MLPFVAASFLIYENLNKPFILESNKILLLEKSLENMRKNTSDFDENYSSKYPEIKIFLAELNTEITETQESFSAVRKEQIKLEREINFLRNIAGITKEQAESVMKIINKNKYMDYIFGFIFGIISSLLSTFIYKKISIRRRTLITH